MIKHATRRTILGVEYTHLELGEGGDLYLTTHGVPNAESLLPENFWLDPAWFRANSKRLTGTSSVYRVATKPVDGVSRNIVLKWNRMGQDVPLHEDTDSLVGARFNSPFEEVALVLELRDAAARTAPDYLIHRPMAIYVPAKRIELRRVGRRESAMKAIIEKHVDIELDMHRTYGVIYEWIDGVDATEAQSGGLIDEERMRELTLEGDALMHRCGFFVRDRKPHHVIVRANPDGSMAIGPDGHHRLGLIDFELLTRTPESAKAVNKQRRAKYHEKMRDRFRSGAQRGMPAGLDRVEVMGVEYVTGHCESTDGRLWVIGKDPDLFEFFLPERWEQTTRTRLSGYSEVYYTVTKDEINLVWKVSKVGVQPDVDPFRDDERRILDFGFNSPFEEVAVALDLTRAGLATIYPRAVYMTGTKTEVRDTPSDPQRYESHRAFVNPDGGPVLRPDRDYIGIWGYWNGPDERLATHDADHYKSVDALRATREGLISRQTYFKIMNRARDRMGAAGIEDLTLRGSHVLVSMLASTGHLIIAPDGVPEFRICNFELLRHVPCAAPGALPIGEGE